MALEGSLRSFLASSTRVTTHVGSSNAARIEPSKLPNGIAYPALVYQRISTDRTHTHDGPAGLANVRMQLDSYDADPAGAIGLADGVRKALDGFTGTMNGLTVQASMSADEEVRWEPEVEVYRVRQDYMIRHREATT